MRKEMLVAALTKESFRRTFGFKQMMDTLGAIPRPATASLLLSELNYQYMTLFALIFYSRLAGGRTDWLRDAENQHAPVHYRSFVNVQSSWAE